MANIAPYPAAHRDNSLPTGRQACSQPGQSTGGLRRVTQTPSTAVPLGGIARKTRDSLL
ncbi:MAG: hypothetical protein IMZ64_00905 [Bacteroidetes bacterium]|nr:hypothetical protein [Bacteroidota bacterium]